MKDFQTKFIKNMTSESLGRNAQTFTETVEDVEGEGLRFDASVSFAYDRHGEVTDTVIDDWKVYDDEGNDVDWLTLDEADLRGMFYACVEAAEDYLPNQSDRAFEYKCAEDDYYADMYDGSEDRFYDD